MIFILFAAMAPFASFALTQQHVISFYGAQPEDISFALQIAYAGIIATLPIQFRLVRYFTTRSYLLHAFILGILVNVGCLCVHDLVLFAVLRFFTGVITCSVAGCMLMAIFSTLPDHKRMVVGMSLFFSLVLTCGLLVGIGGTWVVLRANWVWVYNGLIGLQVIAVVLVTLIFDPRSTTRPYPLYQVDWLGSVLFITGASATAFVMIYGPKRYWFADASILYISIVAAATLLLFLLRQSALKRPLIDLRVFRSGKFAFAILLMLLFWGIKDSINLMYGYAGSVLGWSPADVVNAGMFNVAGVILATIIAVMVILAQKTNLPKLLLAGFAVMTFYHAWVYAYLTPDLSFHALCFPIFLHGFACGLLFVPITIFCMASIPPKAAITGIVICAYARFIATLNSLAGFYTLQLNYSQHFKEGFLPKLSTGSDIFSQRQELYKSLLTLKGYAAGEASQISTMLIAKTSAVQGQLLTLRAIFLLAAVFTTAAFVVLLTFAVVTKMRDKHKPTPAGK